MKNFVIIALLASMMVATMGIAPTGTNGSDSECTLCEYVVTEMETYLNENSTLTEIETFVEKICGMFHGYETICQSLIKTYIPVIIEKLEADITPVEICTDIGICSTYQHQYQNTTTERDKVINVF
jgi:saposin